MMPATTFFLKNAAEAKYKITK
jgi:hypothetical protein